MRFKAAACLRPDCDFPGSAEDTDEYFVERIIGRRPYDPETDADVLQPTEIQLTGEKQRIHHHCSRTQEALIFQTVLG